MNNIVNRPEPETPLISIGRLSGSEIEIAISLVADTMSDNPIHQAIFNEPGPLALKKQHGMFSKALRMETNHLYCAKVNGEIVGLMCYMSSHHCQLKPLQLVTILPSLWSILGKALPRVLAWRLNWKNHDLKQPHIHFGPLAVARDFQGRGVGSALLSAFCRRMDEAGQVAYLETDKEINLGLYMKFGFRVLGTDKLFGVKNWFMVRKPVTLQLG